MDNFILLPTGKFPEVGQLNIAPYNRPGHQLEIIHYVETGAGLNPQHLYQTSNEVIEKNDWYYDPEVDFPIRKITKTGNNGYEGCLKIVATTDPELLEDNLPLIPKEVVDEFIKSYNQVPV